jgi:hypothetical protein
MGLGFSDFLEVFFTVFVHQPLLLEASDAGPAFGVLCRKQRSDKVCTGASGGSRRLSTGRWPDTVHRSVHDDESAWQDQVITRRWSASDRLPANASDVRFPSLKPYWSRPNTGFVASGANERCVRCGVYTSAVSF